MMAAALAAIAGFGMLFSLWWRTGVSDPYEVLRIASQEFVKGRPVVAGELAESVEFEEESDVLDEVESEAIADVEDLEYESPKEKAVREAREERDEWVRLRDFLVGVGKVARAAQEEDLRHRRRFLFEAIPHLESAKNAGFPPGRQTEGYRILGESLFKLGQYDESIEALKATIARDPTLRRELLPILAEAQLSSVAPLTDQSLKTIEGFLGDATLQAEQRWEGELIRIRALIDMKKWRDANESIAEQLQNEPTAKLALQGLEAEFRDHLALLRSVSRIQQATDRYGASPADEYVDRSRAVEELSQTTQFLSDLQREGSPKVAAQARLWGARALLVQGMFDEALTQLTAVRQQRPFGAEAIVGGLEEIELLAKQGRGFEMLLTTRYMMRELGDARGFDASIITFDEFQRRFAEAIDQLRRNGEFKHAIDTARSLPPVVDVSEALTQEGIGYREWAASTIDDGTNIGGEVARSASILARSRYRAAGDAFAEAARLQFNTEEYLATQWSAIDAYQKGRHFSQSIRLLEPYLRYEERRRQPRGLVAFGRALLAEDQPEKAIDALTTCIVEFPRDPLRYDARLLAAQAHAEKGDIENARILLTDNLQDGELTPQSPSWRDSLLTLGELLYERGYRNFLLAEQVDGPEKLAMYRDNQPILEEAVRNLDEAVQRYWPIPRAESAAYLSSRAHVMSSQWPRIESQSPEILDAARRSLRAQADQELKTALDGFIGLRKHLADREEEQRLPNGEQSMLRNCLMAEADVLREMNQLEDAASAYRAVELRYMNEPSALEAILGRATCAKQLGRSQEADKLVRQASVVLQRIPNEWNDRFAETTRYDREGWEELLTWMNGRINSGA
jgi:tetratricopeptide (TPR) repeat protein